MKQKGLRITYWILTILFAAFMVFSGGSQLLQTESSQEVMTNLGYPLYLNTILGVAKLLGVVGILQRKSKVLAEWAYAGFAFDIIGAGLSFYMNGDGLANTLMVVPFLVVMFGSYFCWKRMSK